MTGYATAGTMTTVQQSTDPAAKPTSRKRFLTVAALALMLVPLLAGCIRVQVSMGVSANDRVTGQVVAAAIPANEADKGPQLTPPSSLEDKIRVQEYKKDGYVGSQAFFSDLSFGDVAQLGSMYAEGSGSFQITLKRSGDTVTLDGKADLKTVPTQAPTSRSASPSRHGSARPTEHETAIPGCRGPCPPARCRQCAPRSTTQTQAPEASPGGQESWPGWRSVSRLSSVRWPGWRAIEHRSSARPPRKHRS